MAADQAASKNSPPRAALVTGASSGIGREITLALAREGYDLALTKRNVSGLDELLKHRELAGRRVVPVQLELRDPASIDVALKAAVAGLGRLDVLVNNAGRALIKPVTEITEAEFDDVIATNLRGTFLLSQRFGRYCIENKREGSIVTIASTHGITGIAGRAAYGISKAGLIQMTRMLAIEWALHGIRANAIAPATVLTPSRAEMLKDPKARATMLARIPSGKFIEASEIAAAVVYLASADAASTTGQVIVIDGGMTAT